MPEPLQTPSPPPVRGLWGDAREALRAARAARRESGFRAGVLAGARFALDMWRIRRIAFGARLTLGRDHFEFWDERHRYFVHRYNETWRNERAVELPLAIERLRAARGEVLEVGNVLAHYIRVTHARVDKYERGPGISNTDVVDIEAAPRYSLIISISTLEHVGFDEDPKDPTKFQRALVRLVACLAPGGELFVTLPMGYNPAVDALVMEEIGDPFDQVLLLKRLSADNRWGPCTIYDAAAARYGSPFPAANVLAVCYLRRPAV